MATAQTSIPRGTAPGEALLGARPGDYVRITLPNGRQRRVRVIDVT
jgi:transcription elongation GreA/GreB family factor